MFQREDDNFFEILSIGVHGQCSTGQVKMSQSWCSSANKLHPSVHVLFGARLTASALQSKRISLADWDVGVQHRHGWLALYVFHVPSHCMLLNQGSRPLPPADELMDFMNNTEFVC